MQSGSKERPAKDLLLELESHRLQLQNYVWTWNRKQEELLQGAWDTTQETDDKALEPASASNSLADGGNEPSEDASDKAQWIRKEHVQRKPSLFQVKGNMDEPAIKSTTSAGFFPSESASLAVTSAIHWPIDGAFCEGSAGAQATEHTKSNGTSAQSWKEKLHKNLRMKSPFSQKATHCSTRDLGAKMENGRKRCTISDVESDGTESDPIREQKKQGVHEQAERLRFTRKVSTGNSYISEKSAEERTRCRIRLLTITIVQSHRFENLCAGIIFLNTVFIGLSADIAARDHENKPPEWLGRVELAFCCFYICEVGLRVVADGCGYFFGPEWRWDWFDFLLAVMAAYDQVLHLIFPEEEGAKVQNVSFLRMLRFLKMLRLLRMIRLMKVFRELRLILYAIFGCIQAMFWAVLMILAISYVVGIVVLNACMNYLATAETVDPSAEAQIHRFWSSLGRAMLSLFQAATSGMNWQELAEPLEEIGWALYGLFIIYIAFFVFVIMNTFTSLFVETVMDCSERDQQMLIQLELEKKDEYINKLQAFFDKIDDDRNGLISFEEFCAHADNPTIHAFAASLDIDITDAKQFFKVLSGAGRRAVDIETFVVGCIKLKGWARSIDLMDLVHRHAQQAGDLQVFNAEVSFRMKKLESMIAEVRSQTSCWELDNTGKLLAKAPADPTIDVERSTSTDRFSAVGSESTLLLPNDLKEDQGAACNLCAFKKDQGGNRLRL